MRKPASVALILSCLGLIAGVLSADDWVTGVGGKPDRTGLSGEVGPPVGTLLWKGGGNASFGDQAVIEGGRVFVTRATDDFIFAYDLETGRELWRFSLFPTGGTGRNRVSGARDGQVYVSRSIGFGAGDYLYALDAVDGSVLWRSQSIVEETSYESLSFSAEGDPIVGSFNYFSRIQRGTGQTVWTQTRSCVGSGACGLAVSGTRVYAANLVYPGIGIEAYDVATGLKLYSSLPISTGGSQLQIFTGPGGYVYAPFAQGSASDALIALRDTGSSLVELWRSPLDHLAASSFAVGSDGSVYSYSQAHEVLRLDPVSGAVTSRFSLPVSGGYLARLATDAVGGVYLTVDDGSTPTVYAFNSNLTVRWSAPVPAVSFGGPALGRDGTLVVCGASADLLPTGARRTRPAPCAWMRGSGPARTGMASSSRVRPSRSSPPGRTSLRAA